MDGQSYACTHDTGTSNAYKKTRAHDAMDADFQDPTTSKYAPTKYLEPKYTPSKHPHFEVSATKHSPSQVYALKTSASASQPHNTHISNYMPSNTHNSEHTPAKHPRLGQHTSKHVGTR
jgi:hypothetical protein